MNRHAHHEQSKVFLAHAEDELGKGDLLQASEKGWGAAAQIVKAVADVRGWNHRGHSHLFRTVGRIADERDDSEIRLLFASANDLHINFYDRYLDKHEVEVRLATVARFVDKMDVILTTP